MGVMLDKRPGGHTDKIRGYSTPLKRHSENAATEIMTFSSNHLKYALLI